MEYIQRVKSTVTRFKLTSAQDGLVLEFDHFWASELEPEKDTPKSIVLMIHGYGDNKPYYRPLADHLAQSQAQSNVVLYDQRQHGIYNSNKDAPYISSTDEFEADAFQALEHLRETYPTSKLYLYGHSMGGAIVSTMCLEQTDRARKLGLSGVILEAPYMDVHPDTGTWHLKLMARIVAYIYPSLILPQDLKAEFCVRDETIRQVMIDDDQRTGKCRAGTAYFFINKGHYFVQKREHWPLDIPVQLHVPFCDRVCDTRAALAFFDNIAGKHSCNAKYIYNDACHDLKSDLVDVRTEFFKNVTNYILNINTQAGNMNQESGRVHS